MWKFLLCLVTLQLVLTAVCSSQEHAVEEGYAGCGKYPFLVFGGTGDPLSDPTPIPSHYFAEEHLTEAGIALTNATVRSALRDGRAEVRYSAAWYLADQNVKGAISDIFGALQVERVSRAKAYLACALAELGDKRGGQALHRYCADADFPSGIKQDVSNFLLELHETGCPAAEASRR